MVCVPCVLIPVFLIIFRFLIQPLLTKYWKYVTGDPSNKSKPLELIKECTNGTCKLSWKKQEDKEESDTCKAE